MAGTLFVVATPIGNLEDITIRAIRVLRGSNFCVCEDTRITRKIFFRYAIRTPLVICHQHSSEAVMNRIVQRILEGENAALVTDAGTPGISDPGNRLVERVVKAGAKVSPIPGASALAAFVSVAGIDMQQFVFLGFPPHKKGRETFFSRIADLNIPVVYFDSPYRMAKNLTFLSEKKDSLRVIVGRELTKTFEEIMRGNAAEVAHFFMEHPEKNRGEFILIVYSK